MERSYSVPVPAGSRAILGLELDDAFSLAGIKKLLAAQPGVITTDDVASSRDVVGSPVAAHIDLGSLKSDRQRIEFSMAYDSDWSRANRILDTARRMSAEPVA